VLDNAHSSVNLAKPVDLAICQETFIATSRKRYRNCNRQGLSEASQTLFRQNLN